MTDVFSPLAITLSIIIPNHNYAVFLPDLFGDLSRQRGGLADVEVILVDDASGDGSPELATVLMRSLDDALTESICLPR